MNSAIAASLSGLMCASVGLMAEWQRIPGFCYETGYCHLSALSSFFYALGNPTQVLTTVFILNFVIGTLIPLPTIILMDAIKRGRATNEP